MTLIPKGSYKIAELIYAHYEAQREQPRAYLGVSLLGHPCARYLWLSFRWAVDLKFPGRILRLFERGRHEEEVLVQNLRDIGVKIHNTCLDSDGQFHVDFGNHIEGHLDGIIESGVPEAPKKRHIAEFKTHNLKSFSSLKHNGVKKSKFQHWVQMQCYMCGTKIDRALYVAVCKDNDEIYTERIEYNPEAAKFFLTRGYEIVKSDKIPPPLGKDASWYQCKMCPYCDFCYVNKLSKNINCRTCAKFTACDEKGRYKCEYFPCLLGIEDQYEGCSYHTMHPDLASAWICKGAVPDNTALIYEINGRNIINGGDSGQTPTAVLLDKCKTEITESLEVPF